MENLVHVLTQNHEGNETRGWQLPAAIYGDIENAVHEAEKRVGISAPEKVEIESYRLNTLYLDGPGTPNPTDERLWGWHNIAGTTIQQNGYLDDREYPNGYPEYQRYLELRDKLLSPQEKAKEDEEIRSAKAKQLELKKVHMPDLYVISLHAQLLIGDVTPTVEVVKGLYEEENIAVSVAEQRAQASDQHYSVHKIPVNIFLGGGNFFTKENLIIDFKGNQNWQYVAEMDEYRRLKAIYHPDIAQLVHGVAHLEGSPSFF